MFVPWFKRIQDFPPADEIISWHMNLYYPPSKVDKVTTKATIFRNQTKINCHRILNPYLAGFLSGTMLRNVLLGRE